jgi:hypothetical protein
MDPRIEEALQFINTYAPEIYEWKILKKELMKHLHPQVRKLFSTRDPVTKRQNFNDLEKCVADRWEIITGKEILRQV